MHIAKLEPLLKHWNEQDVIEINEKEDMFLLVNAHTNMKRDSITKRIHLWINPREYINLECSFSAHPSNADSYNTPLAFYLNVGYYIDNVWHGHYNTLFLKRHIHILENLRENVHRWVGEIEEEIHSRSLPCTVLNDYDYMIEKLKDVTPEAVEIAESTHQRLQGMDTEKLHRNLQNHMKKHAIPNRLKTLKEDINQSLDDGDEELFAILSKELNRYRETI